MLTLIVTMLRPKKNRKGVDAANVALLAAYPIPAHALQIEFLVMWHQNVGVPIAPIGTEKEEQVVD